MTPDENIVRYRSPAGISNSKGETVNSPAIPTTTNNRPIINSRPAYVGSYKDEESKLADNPAADSIVDQMLGIIQNMLSATGGAIQQAIGCPGQGLKRRGWKIDSNGVQFAPCGCYVDAIWPHVLGVGAAAGAAKGLLAKLLRKRFLRVQSRLFAARYATQILDRINKSFDHLQRGITIGVAFKNRKMPPVAAGYVRMYRGVGSKVQRQCDGTLPTLPGIDGRYWTNDINYAEWYAKNRTTGDFDELSHIYYVDIPQADFDRYRLDAFSNMSGMDRQVWLRTDKIIKENIGGGPIDLGPLSDLEVVQGQWYLDNKEFPSIRIQDPKFNFNEQMPNGNKLNEQKMPLIREINGKKHVVIDFPKPEDKAFNAHVFAGSKTAGDQEWFLPESLLEGKEVAAFVDTEVQDKLKCGIKPLHDALNAMKGNEEKFLSDSAFREQWIQKVTEGYDKWLDTQDLFDENFELNEFVILGKQNGHDIGQYRPKIEEAFDELGNAVLECYTSIMDQAGWFLIFLNAFLSMWLVIEIVMNATTIVEDKKCNTTMLGVSLDGGPIDDHYIGTHNATDQFRLHAIRQKLPVPATMDPDTCECKVCPDSYLLCDKSSLTNLWDDRRNMCFPECCGGKQLQPISLTQDCGCECPEGYTFQECKKSDCLSHVNNPSYIMYWLTGNWDGFGKKPFYGSCFPNNPNPSKLEWNADECGYVCSGYEIVTPAVLMGGSARVPLPPCPDGSMRTPPDCECLPPPSPPPVSNLRYVYNTDTDTWETID